MCIPLGWRGVGVRECSWRPGSLPFEPLFAALPEPSGYVNDFASILDEPSETDLETFLTTLERDTSAEVVVTTVKSLDGMTIEDTRVDCSRKWGIGHKQRVTASCSSLRQTIGACR